MIRRELGWGFKLQWIKLICKHPHLVHFQVYSHNNPKVIWESNMSSQFSREDDIRFVLFFSNFRQKPHEYGLWNWCTDTLIQYRILFTQCQQPECGGPRRGGITCHRYNKICNGFSCCIKLSCLTSRVRTERQEGFDTSIFIWQHK